MPTVGLYLHINSYSSSADVIYPYHDLLDSKVHGANMGPIWGRQDPDGPHVGHKYLTIWVAWKFDGMLKNCPNMTSYSSDMFHGTGHQSTKISCRIIKCWMNCTSIIPDVFISCKYQSCLDYAKMANNGNFKQWIKCNFMVLCIIMSDFRQKPGILEDSIVIRLRLDNLIQVLSLPLSMVMRKASINFQWVITKSCLTDTTFL